jgi:GDP-L-fucose synthase
MEKHSKIYIAGHRGMVGSAIVRHLESEGFEKLIYKTSADLDLRNQNAVESFFKEEKPEFVFLAAAKVGGIQANNTLRAEFLYDNLMIEANIIHSSYKAGVKKLLFLGSSCIYPKHAKQPMNENDLLTGILEPTNEPYAIAKIAGIKLCEAYWDQFNCAFISGMPTNLYGPNDNYNLQNSHVLPALMRKFLEAELEGKPNVEIWGDGSPLREFMHVDDLARASVFLMNYYQEKQFINIGTGDEISIREIAEFLKEISGFKGSLVFDSSKPNGTPRKLMDSSRLLGMGFKPSISLSEGISSVYSAFKKEYLSDSSSFRS